VETETEKFVRPKVFVFWAPEHFLTAFLFDNQKQISCFFFWTIFLQKKVQVNSRRYVTNCSCWSSFFCNKTFIFIQTSSHQEHSTLSLSLPLSLSNTHSLSLSLSLTHTLYQSVSLTHTHTHTALSVFFSPCLLQAYTNYLFLSLPLTNIK